MLSLAPHVRACLCQDQFILLDLRHSRYTGLPAGRFAPLVACVQGWPVPRVLPHPSTLPTPDLMALAAPLVQRGLLCPAAFTPADVLTPPPARQTLQPDLAVASGSAKRNLPRAMRSAVRTAQRLHTQSLEAITQHLKRRRQPATTPRPADLQALGQGVSAYLHVRPWLLTARDHCLLDTLVLLDFLAAEQVYPSLVIGVATSPFMAHAWAQHGELVFNDLHEHVRRYTPILVA